MAASYLAASERRRLRRFGARALPTMCPRPDEVLAEVRRVIAALAGVTIPIGLHASGRDPAHGSSVLLTFVTNVMGFFLFLGLATLFPL